MTENFYFEEQKASPPATPAATDKKPDAAKKEEEKKKTPPPPQTTTSMPMWQKVVAGIALSLAIILLLYVLFKVIPKNTAQPQPQMAPVQQQTTMGGAKKGNMKCGKQHVHKPGCKAGKAGKAWRGGGCGCAGTQQSQ